MSQAKVLLIAGAAHGGTTITSIVLGQHPDVFITGKMRGFPKGDLFDDDNVCSCGEGAKDCGFWREVRRRFRPAEDTSELDRLTRLYTILSEVSGRPYVVDVTHNAADVERFFGSIDLDFRLLHVNRSLNAVVYSRIRKDQEIGRVKNIGPGRLMRVAKVARHWHRQRLGFLSAEQHLCERALRIDYQGLCLNPQQVLSDVGRFMNVNFDAVIDDLQGGEPLHQPFHFIRGNKKLRSKLQQQNQVRLRYDDAYRRELKPVEQFLCNLGAKLA